MDMLERIRGELHAQAEPEFRKSVQRFFREPVDAYGVRTPAVRGIASTVYREVRQWPPAERNRLCNELWKSGKPEEGTLAVCLYEKFARQCGPCEFHLFEKWIDRFVTNWAHCDGVCSLLWITFENDPKLLREIRPWTAAPNRWKRRAAAVALVCEARRGRNAALIATTIARLSADPDDMVRKAVVWLRREARPPRRIRTRTM